jgi:hypothetical protein
VLAALGRNLLGRRDAGAFIPKGTTSPEQTEEALKPIRSLGHPLLHQVGPAPFPVVQSLFDGLFVPGLQWYWRADNFTDLNEEAIAQHAKHGSAIPTMLSTMHLYPVNGAAQRCRKKRYGV